MERKNENIVKTKEEKDGSPSHDATYCCLPVYQIRTFCIVVKISLTKKYYGITEGRTDGRTEGQTG